MAVPLPCFLALRIEKRGDEGLDRTPIANDEGERGVIRSRPSQRDRYGDGSRCSVLGLGNKDGCKGMEE